MPSVEIKAADHEDMVAALKHEEGYQTVTFGGDTYHWFLSGLGIRKAQKEGYRPLRLMSDLAQMGVRAARASASKNGRRKKYLEGIDEDAMLVHYGVLFYAGTSAFYDHSLNSILARMTVRRMSEVQGVIIDEIRRMAEAATPTETEDAGAEGNLTTTP